MTDLAARLMLITARLIDDPTGEIPPSRPTEIDPGRALFPMSECPPGPERVGLPTDAIAGHRRNTWASTKP